MTCRRAVELNSVVRLPETELILIFRRSSGEDLLLITDHLEMYKSLLLLPMIATFALDSFNISFSSTDPLSGSGSPLAVTVESQCDPRSTPNEGYWLGMFASDANLSGIAKYHNFCPPGGCSATIGWLQPPSGICQGSAPHPPIRSNCLWRIIASRSFWQFSQASQPHK